jgi:hypothetical protein
LAASAFLEGVLMVDSCFRLIFNPVVVLNMAGNSTFFRQTPGHCLHAKRLSIRRRVVIKKAWESLNFILLL